MKNKHSYSGLSDKEVLVSREQHGCNIITPREKEALWKRFLEKFGDPLIIILLVAGTLSIGVSCYEYFMLDKGFSIFFEPMGIFIAILLATGLAFIFEIKADKEFTLLNKINDDELVQVIRNGFLTVVPKRDVVVGDIVRIETGNEIPADGELLECMSLHVDESSLTGEPICFKSVVEHDFQKDATFPTNHVMRGTKVMEGYGIFKVLHVGDQTENGKVMEAVQIDDSVCTPLNEQLDRLGSLIEKASYAFAVLIIAGRLFAYFHQLPSLDTFTWMDFSLYILQTIMIAVTLIVVAVPEGLPMAVTLSLAYSMRRMLQTNNLVRRMHACETMGATTVICTDKTGTLTQNCMTVAQTDFYGLNDRKLDDSEIGLLIKEGLSVNSTASLDQSATARSYAIGNPTEGALLLWLAGAGVDYRQLRDQSEVLQQIPFSTELKYMATIVDSQLLGKKVLYVKGAPEIVYSLCSRTSGNATQLEIDTQLSKYQAQAMRTLGFAYRILESDESPIVDGKIACNNLTFLGIVAISDPIRIEVPHAVKECVNAGIKVKIVTGDTSGTAKEIARQIGLWEENEPETSHITGAELTTLSGAELKRRLSEVKVISRARPMDKRYLVENLQSLNEVVAVTGDGTNDAPALKAAHVGLSMGDGTSVAKEASDITIIDNSFSSIARAVMWGRSLFQNIQRFILFQLTVNVAACFIVLVGSFMGTESPLTVTQMLWVNLIMDTFAAMALASLPPDESVMKESPRDRESFIISSDMKKNIIAVGGLFFLFLWGLLYVLQHASINQMSDFLDIKFEDENHLSPYELSVFFTIFVFLQLWNLFNAKAFKTGRSAFHFKGCQGFCLIVALIFVGQIAIISLGGSLFNIVPLSLLDWLVIICATSVVLVIGEMIRFFGKKEQV